MIALQVGTQVRVINGSFLGLTGTVLQGSVWPRRGRFSRAGTLYQVQLDGVSEQSRSVRSNVVRYWDTDIEKLN